MSATVDRRMIASNAFRWSLATLMVAFLVFSLWGGTSEGRVGILLAFLTGLVSAPGGLVALVVVSPLALLDASKTHMLILLDGLVAGILAGALLRRGSGGRDWGVWPAWITGTALLVLAASWIGFLNLFFMEFPEGIPANRFYQSLNWAFYGAATEPPWVIRATWNFLTGLGIAVVAARAASPLFAARWMKIAGLALVAVAVLSLLSLTEWFSFSHIRRPNPDPLHMGRLQGPAGHAGWFAQWIVFAWPGIALWWKPGGRLRNVIVAGGFALALVVLVLTGARASLIGLMAAAAVAGALPWGGRAWNAKALVVIPVGVVLLLVAGVLAQGSIGSRLTTLARFQDRANYYVSTWHFLHDMPMGVGLGMHSRAYEARFTEFWPWYQWDHVTAHSSLLHTLAEGGPFLALMLGLGVVLLGIRFLCGWSGWDADTRRTASVLAASFLGLAVVSFMQDLFYIRAIELLTWALGGMIVGLARTGGDGQEDGEWLRPRLLMGAGIAAIIVMTTGAFRFDPGSPWRRPEGNRETGLVLWTPLNWRTAIPHNTELIEFTMHRLETPCRVEILVGGERVFSDTLRPGEWMPIRLEVDLPGSRARHPIQWLEIRTSPGWVPANVYEGSGDHRLLGVYVQDLNFIGNSH